MLIQPSFERTAFFQLSFDRTAFYQNMCITKRVNRHVGVVQGNLRRSGKIAYSEQVTQAFILFKDVEKETCDINVCLAETTLKFDLLYRDTL